MKMIKYLKLENIENHDYFIQTVDEIQSQLGLGYSVEEIEKKCLDDGYLLYFKNKATKRWHLGIWAVGKWDIKEQYEYEGEVKIWSVGYGIEHYKPLTISVFLIHDWTYDKFRPSRADVEILLEKDKPLVTIDTVSTKIKDIIDNPIDSYYNFFAKTDEEGHKQNKYISYFNAYWGNVISPFIYTWKERIIGYIVTKAIKVIAHTDRRVSYVTHKFYKDKWNSEYNIAIVFKNGKTDWHDWKVWNDYSKLYNMARKLTYHNIDISFSYLNGDGSIPEILWRGIYWDDEPLKENKVEENNNYETKCKGVNINNSQSI